MCAAVTATMFDCVCCDQPCVVLCCSLLSSPLHCGADGGIIEQGLARPNHPEAHTRGCVVQCFKVGLVQPKRCRESSPADIAALFTLNAWLHYYLEHQNVGAGIHCHGVSGGGGADGAGWQDCRALQPARFRRIHYLVDGAPTAAAAA